MHFFEWHAHKASTEQWDIAGPDVQTARATTVNGIKRETAIAGLLRGAIGLAATRDGQTPSLNNQSDLERDWLGIANPWIWIAKHKIECRHSSVQSTDKSPSSDKAE